MSEVYRPEHGKNPEEDISVFFETFSEAREARKDISDEFIDGALAGKLRVGADNVGIKGFLDRVETDEQDLQIIHDPERIAKLYASTTEMLLRNLKVKVSRSDKTTEETQSLQEKVGHAADLFSARTQEEMTNATSGIVDWCKKKTRSFPVDAMEYHGFTVGGHDVLNADTKGIPDVRTNFKIQRQLSGTFIMGYSDTRVAEKMTGEGEVLDKRIYLNPDMEAAPLLFERLLQFANQEGVSLQLKMLQRASEVASVYMQSKGRKVKSLRGDGIVIYASSDNADDVLKKVLELTKESPAAFRGRKTSRIPQTVAEGIAIGDEPTQMPGTSLTSHREKILSYVVDRVRSSGKSGKEAHALFRELVTKTATANKVNPDNIAFNRG